MGVTSSINDIINAYLKAGWNPENNDLPSTTAMLLAQAGPQPFINAKAAPFYARGDYNAATGSGQTDDTAALQAAINFCQLTGAELYIPSGYYLISAPLVISNTLRIRGAGAYEIFGNTLIAGSNSQQMPSISPYLTGTVFVQSAQATDIVQVKASGVSVDLCDFGMMFQSLYTNTGHGINTIPPTFGAHQHPGVISGKWSNLKVFGHDGNHYSFVLTNQLYCTFDHIRGYGGGFLWIVNNSSTCDYGNATFQNNYGCCFLAGTSHMVYLDASASPSTNWLNLISFIRHQGFFQTPNPAIAGTTPPTSSQNNLQYAGVVKGIWFPACDFECTPQQNQVVFPPTSSAYNAGGGLINQLASYSNINPNSGAVSHNIAGSLLNFYWTFTFAPTGGAAATLSIAIGPNSDASGGFTPVSVSFPAGGPTPVTQTVNFSWPAGWYMKPTWNAQVTQTGAYGPPYFAS